jgi:predicted O-linked N-acetylglucosamine transferase (SPINDLY family)
VLSQFRQFLTDDEKLSFTDADFGANRDWMKQELKREMYITAFGIDASRVEFVGRKPRRRYMELYQRIDLGLDTFPYNGHTTSLDSTWMGVPVVTLVGQTAVGRAGWSQLSNLRLTELAALSEKQFIEVAVALANDRPRLAELRQTLRSRMERSPLMDTAAFARNIEAALRQMWRAWAMV